MTCIIVWCFWFRSKCDYAADQFNNLKLYIKNHWIDRYKPLIPSIIVVYFPIVIFFPTSNIASATTRPGSWTTSSPTSPQCTPARTATRWGMVLSYCFQLFQYCVIVLVVKAKHSQEEAQVKVIRWHNMTYTN